MSAEKGRCSHEYGIDSSAGQSHRLLTEGRAAFHREKAEGLRAGLTVSSSIGTDDTGAQHQRHNGYCTVIGNDLFGSFGSSNSKSRMTFLHVLHGGQRRYAISGTAVAYWQREKLAAALVGQLTAGPQEFATDEAWQQ